ncbi:MAG: C1 family peptidase, partial [Bacteroidaceae bacterium]|nr:C1 family peptidase [Bacteroidaceae bacterium]
MNKFLLMAVAAICSLPTMAQKADSLVFTTVLENPVTSIKNQNNSGTCWSYSALAFLESEVLKKDPSKKDIDLCESFLVSKTYTDRADRNVRTHGDASFSQGGSFYDAIFCMERYGLVPEGLMPYPITPYGDSLFNFTNFFPPMEAYIKAIATSNAKKINPIWKKDVQGMLDNYFGECPTEFEYKGKKYTPQSFVKDYLKLDPNDYVSLTSYTHHPFYSSFVLEIQDNWRWATSYNLPLDEFMRVMEESVKNGWTFAWGAD